jgi:MFS family permease
MNSVFKNKDYVLLFFGQLVSNMGTALYNFAISLYILTITDGDAIAAGLYMAFGGIVFFALTLFGGAIVDRLDKVKVVYITDYINGIVIVIAGFVILGGIPNTLAIVLLYVVSFVLGVNAALFNPAIRSLPAHILEENQLQQHSSLQQGIGAAYGIIGTMLGGVMYAFVPIEWIFIINGITFILSGISESFIGINTSPDVAEEENKITFRGTLKDIGLGFDYIYKVKPIFNLIVIAAFLNFFTVPVIVNGFPYLFEVTLEAEPYYYALIMSLFPAGVIVSSIVLGVSKQKERVSGDVIKGLFGMAVFFTINAIGVYLHLNGYINFLVFMIVSSVSVVVTGFFNAYVNVPFSVAIMKVVDKDKMGRVFSVISIITNGVTPIAIGLGGFAIAYLGIGNLFIAAVVSMFVTAILAKLNKQINLL